MAQIDVRLVGVSKRFGDTVAVDHIDLEVEAGEFFSLLGPSGCGKTTTLRMIGGFEQPTEGRIELQGETSPGCRRTVGTSTPSSRTTPSFPTSTSTTTLPSGFAAGGSLSGRSGNA